MLRRILAEHDWPGHSDHAPAFQGAATTLLGRAVQAGDAPVQHWAHLHDRALITSGRDQEYGTQPLLCADGIELCPQRTPESVDARRATVGLRPVAVPLQAVRRRYTPDGFAKEAPTLVRGA
ncbi:DUF6624 domain-containing protein [Streptomyces sp. NPDC058308]|uniref:DUF6624 domain-containing protein n=1 Tax=Streptomyces sp. NPDC058308 TaxID=3346440 RepID=UPI0036EE79B4